MSDCGNVQKVFVPVEEDKQESLNEAPQISGVGISDIAAEKIKHFCKVDGKSAEDYGLHVAVVKDGCSGNSYTMDLKPIANAQEEGAKLFTHNGATIMIEKLSYMFVIGSIVDYAETLLMSGFQIVNPNVKRTCSCGSSFTVK